jgi:hypothetical protein
LRPYDADFAERFLPFELGDMDGSILAFCGAHDF